MTPLRLLYAVTVPMSARAFLRGQLSWLRDRGHDVHLLSSPAPASELTEVGASEGVRTHAVGLEREISPRADLAALVGVWSAIRAVRPDVTNVGTPKAGLIGGLAAVLARVPARVYTMHGLRLETARGWKRTLLTVTERVACACAHEVVCVSPSLREQAVKLGVVTPGKARVLGEGSVNGVDPAAVLTDPARTAALREELGLPQGTPVVGFVGRFTRDKGIAELLDAFETVAARFPQARLLLLGSFEAGDPVGESERSRIERGERVVWPGFVRDVPAYYALMDLLVLPTYREGYPTVVLEAGAAGLPVVSTTATGARDAVVHGVTGLTVPVGDSAALAEAITTLLADPSRARELGRAGRAHVLAHFAQDRVWAAWEELYGSLLERRLAGRRVMTDRRKRLLDVVVSASALLVLAVPMAALALLVRVRLGSPVLFAQERPGLRGRPFTMYKFRTMTDARDHHGQLLPDAQRLTPFGRFLRATSLDELPELWNVLKGDMSLVGPRPLLMDYLDLYTPRQARRHEVRPGVTGWAQINGRNSISWEERFELDVWYIDHRSLRLDLVILWRTLAKVMRRDGVSASDHATMPKFRGRVGAE